MIELIPTPQEFLARVRNQKSEIITQMINTDAFRVRWNNEEADQVFETGLHQVAQKITSPHIYRLMCIKDYSEFLTKAQMQPIGFPQEGVGNHWSWDQLDHTDPRRADFANTGKGMQLSDQCPNIVRLTASQYHHAIDFPETIAMQSDDFHDENEVQLRYGTDDRIFLQHITLIDSIDAEKIGVTNEIDHFVRVNRLQKSEKIKMIID